MPSREDEAAAERPVAAGSIVVYWRPGCPWCGRLLRWIDGAALPVDRRNIWDEPEAAIAVRAITGGDETVPTVTVGEVSLVNPSPKVLAAAVREHLPHLLPEEDGQDEPWWRRVGRGD
jgi:mycoredoxin